MDGVISDSYSFHFDAWRKTFARRSVEFAEEDFADLFGSRNDFIIGSVMGKQVPKRTVESMIREKEEAFRRSAMGRIKPFAGVVALLDALKKGNFKLGLVSSAPMENINLALSELDLTGAFDCIVSGQDVARSKPSPQIYLLAAEKLRTLPSDCVVIEDSPLGVSAAKTAGMKCVAVTNSHHPQQLQEADKIVDSLENVDLITLLMRF
jgi:HAD superfamily hydrolase (TIGR01509 family)